MTGRGVLLLDRFVVLLLGVGLVAGGAAAALWRIGWLDDVLGDAPDSLDTSVLLSPVDTDWWPWAAGAGGVLAVLLALGWLLRHVPRQRVSTLRLPGSTAAGRLEADSGPIAQAAADSLGAEAGIRSASGSVRRERGVLVLVLTADVDPASSLPDVVAAAERVGAEASAVVGRDDVRCRIRLRAGTGRSQMARVD